MAESQQKHSTADFCVVHTTHTHTNTVALHTHTYILHHTYAYLPTYHLQSTADTADLEPTPTNNSQSTQESTKLNVCI